jgi:hypothetical protein
MFQDIVDELQFFALVFNFDICGFGMYGTLVARVTCTMFRLHPSKCSALRRVLVLDLTFFIKPNSCSQRWLPPNTGGINKTCLLVSGNYSLANRAMLCYKKCTRAEQSTSAGRSLRTRLLICAILVCGGPKSKFPSLKKTWELH